MVSILSHRSTHRRMITATLVAFGLLAFASFEAASGELRRINTIATPTSTPIRIVGVPVTAVIPVEEKTVNDAVTELVAAWNTTNLLPLLSDQFIDGQRLIDTIFEVAPRDATFRLLAIRSVRTLSQARRAEGADGTAVVSVVSAIVRGQIEFNDPTRGFQRLDSNLNLILEITQIVGPSKPTTPASPTLVSGR